MKEKTLIGNVKINDFDEIAQIYLVNSTYYSVIYKEKEEYYTVSKELAIEVGKIILLFFKSLKHGGMIIRQGESEEEKWIKLTRYLSKEHNLSPKYLEVYANVYHSLESSYFDMEEFEDRAILSKRNAIRSKDNLLKAIVGTIFPIDEIKEVDSLDEDPDLITKLKEIKRNVDIYKDVRNKYVNNNPKLKLELLNWTPLEVDKLRLNSN